MGIIKLAFLFFPILVVIFAENKSGKENPPGTIVIGAIVLGVSYWAVGKIGLPQAAEDILAILIWYVCFFVFSVKFHKFVLNIFGAPEKGQNADEP